MHHWVFPVHFRMKGSSRCTRRCDCFWGTEHCHSYNSTKTFWLQKHLVQQCLPKNKMVAWKSKKCSSSPWVQNYNKRKVRYIIFGCTAPEKFSILGFFSFGWTTWKLFLTRVEKVLSTWWKFSDIEKKLKVVLKLAKFVQF